VDDLLTQGPVGVAVLILVFAALMTLAFGPPGNLLCDLLTRSLAPLGDLVAAGASWMPQVLRSLLTEGVLSGVGTVLSFLPRLLLLWLGIGMLEDSGYLPRAARLADPFMARIGLCGEALIPLLLGFGCSVPAAMTTRTVADPHQRERVLRLLPLVTCSARMPLFSLLAEAFFGGDRPFGTLLFCAGMYVLSVAVVLLTAALQTALTAAVTDAKTARPGAVTAMKHSQDSGKAGPGLKPTVAANRNKLAACGAGTCSCGAACGVGPDRERPLPPLAWPSVGAVLSEAAGRLAAFLGRVSGVILLTSLLAWLLLHTSPRLTWVAEPGTGEECLLLLLGRWLLPLTTPLGLSHPALAAALLAGVGAKESIVSVLAICLTGLTGGAADGSADLTRLGAALAASGWLTPASALSLAVFAAFYMPCTAALSSLASEWPGPRSGQRHGPRHGPRAGLFLALLRSLLLAWVLAWLAGRLAFLFGL
jgi:ferrous iron transport protein B